MGVGASMHSQKSGATRRNSFIRKNDTRGLERDTLVINNRSLSPGDISHLNHGILTKQQILKFGLVYCYLTPNANGGNLNMVGNMVLDEVIQVFRNNQSLESIKMKGPFPRHRDDLVDLLLAMDQMKNLREIAIGAWYWAQYHVPFDKAWIPTVQNNQHTLNRLSLDCFDLSESMSNMTEALQHSNNLSFLGLRNCHITDDGLQKLVDCMVQENVVEQLTTLHLACNTALTTKSLPTLGQLISGHTSLEYLDLIGNKTCFEAPQQEEIESFVDVVGRNTTLKRLSLVSCGLVDDIAELLFASLKKNTTLKRLELDYNELTRANGMNKYCLKVLPHLKLTHLGMCGLRDIQQVSIPRTPEQQQHGILIPMVQEGRGNDRHHNHITSSWRCDGNMKTLRFLRHILAQNEHLLSFSIDCTCCQVQSKEFLQRNAIVHHVSTEIEQILSVGLHPLWMDQHRIVNIDASKSRSISSSTMRRKQAQQQYKILTEEQRRIHATTMYCFLQRNSHQFRPLSTPKQSYSSMHK